MNLNDKRIGELKKLLTEICSALVDYPKEMKITNYFFGEDEDRRLAFVIDVAKEEVGKLIGKKGRMIESIRTIMRASGKLSETRVVVQFKGEGIRE